MNVNFLERSATLIEYDGETYLTASEVAKRFKISRGTCYSNILKHMQKCYLPGRKHALYRLSEVEQVSQVRIVEKSPELVAVDCSVSAERVLAAKQLHALPSPLTIVS